MHSPDAYSSRPAQQPLPWKMLLIVLTVFWAYTSFTTVTQWELMAQALPSMQVLRPGVQALTCVLLYPVLIALTSLSRRVGYDLRPWRTQVAAHIGLALVFGLCARPAMVAARAIADDMTLSESLARMDGPQLAVAARLWTSAALYDAMQYLVLQGLLAGLAFYLRYREEQGLRANLAVMYERARLNALRMQISPHFLYNTLSAVAGLVRTNPQAAEGMVTRLGELFRRALAERDSELVSFEQELEYAENYLEIQRMRFAERLTYSIDVEKQLLTSQLPPLLLQPLLENAVEHGLHESEGAVHISLTARSVDGRVGILVRNRGDGTAPQASSPRSRQGLGLRNVRERLAAAYSGAAELALRAGPPGEYEVSLRLPCTQHSAVPDAVKA